MDPIVHDRFSLGPIATGLDIDFDSGFFCQWNAARYPNETQQISFTLSGVSPLSVKTAIERFILDLYRVNTTAQALQEDIDNGIKIIS